MRKYTQTELFVIYAMKFVVFALLGWYSFGYAFGFPDGGHECYARVENDKIHVFNHAPLENPDRVAPEGTYTVDVSLKFRFISVTGFLVCSCIVLSSVTQLLNVFCCEELQG